MSGEIPYKFAYELEGQAVVIAALQENGNSGRFPRLGRREGWYLRHEVWWEDGGEWVTT